MQGRQNANGFLPSLHPVGRCQEWTQEIKCQEGTLGRPVRAFSMGVKPQGVGRLWSPHWWWLLQGKLRFKAKQGIHITFYLSCFTSFQLLTWKPRQKTDSFCHLPYLPLTEKFHSTELFPHPPCLTSNTPKFGTMETSGWKDTKKKNPGNDSLQSRDIQFAKQLRLGTDFLWI